jgi:alkylhydroperoxidase/carboxymuconolactone decarboxylase family protein YurZ
MGICSKSATHLRSACVSISPSTHIPFEQMPAELQQLLGQRVQRLGYLGEFFQRAAHQPEALTAFYSWTEALKRALPERLVETIALTVASHTGNEYERVQHERLAMSQGMTREEVLALERMRAGTCSSFSDEEVAAAALARCLLEDCGRGCDSALLRLSRLIGEEGTTACLMVGARYVAHATMANAWNLRPPVRSPLDPEPIDAR